MSSTIKPERVRARVKKTTAIQPPEVQIAPIQAGQPWFLISALFVQGGELSHSVDLVTADNAPIAKANFIHERLDGMNAQGWALRECRVTQVQGVTITPIPGFAAAASAQ